ncbi:TagK domain-containing protein [Paraburkholderia susongensis]|uniref:TagK domain-containing protein n=1 Tax=Paraburkholderia susongensis TaxID=1515439 RepID=A0A1X7LME9_9BURK|nr:TagK domain-containing protein [Paraburkholderia susongensis]SMG54299.1 hypothetical protein SAMN06265784_106351 [Paraburkholderia susongensis]
MRTPTTVRIEPVLTKPEDLSDLVALADDNHCDPLHIGRELLAQEDDAHAGTTMLAPSDVHESDPLAALTLEYRRALLSQKSTGTTHELRTTTAHESAPPIRAQHDPFADLADPSHGESSVFDLLMNGKNVDTLLDSLDSFGAGQIFESDESHEILALLAPRGVSARRTSPAAPLAREEHHMVSVDSHMPTPDSIEYEEPESPDENDR